MRGQYQQESKVVRKSKVVVMVENANSSGMKRERNRCTGQAGNCGPAKWR